MPTPDHDKQQHNFTQTRKRAAQTIVLARHASTQAHRTIRRRDFKEHGELTEPGVATDDMAALDDADEKKRKELEPDVVRELFLEVRCDAGRAAVVLLQPNRALFVRVCLAQREHERVARHVHDDEVRDQTGGRERREADDVCAGRAQAGGLEEAVEDARARRYRFDGGHADV